MCCEIFLANGNKTILNSILRPRSALPSPFLLIIHFQWRRKPLPGNRQCGLSSTCRRRTEPWTQATCIKNLVRSRVWFTRYPGGQTDPQTHRQTYSSQYFATAPVGEVTILVGCPCPQSYWWQQKSNPCPTGKKDTTIDHSIGSSADLRFTRQTAHPVGCQYFLPGSWLPYQLQSVTILGRYQLTLKFYLNLIKIINYASIVWVYAIMFYCFSIFQLHSLHLPVIIKALSYLMFGKQRYMCASGSSRDDVWQLNDQDSTDQCTTYCAIMSRDCKSNSFSKWPQNRFED